MADDADGNEVDPTGEDPFSNMPLFGDLSRALSGQGPLNWDAARQFALLGREPFRRLLISRRRGTRFLAGQPGTCETKEREPHHHREDARE